LLRAGVLSGFHWLTAKDTSGATGGDNVCGIAAQLAGLGAGETADETGVLVAFDFEVVGDDDEAVSLFVKTEFHTAGAELFAGFEIEFDRFVAAGEVNRTLRELVEDLLQGPPEGVKLLFFHPDDEGLAIDDGEEAEPAFARFADRLHSRALRIPRFPIPRRHFVLPSPLWSVLAPAM
jgi:hypothetical protein